MKFTERLEGQRNRDAEYGSSGMTTNLGKLTESKFEDEKFFEVERQAGKLVPMLDLRLKDGNSVGIPYAYISQIMFNINGEIKINCADSTYLIMGINLIQLYRYLLRNNVIYIQEADAEINIGNDKKLFVERIVVPE